LTERGLELPQQLFDVLVIKRRLVREQLANILEILRATCEELGDHQVLG
jgi:hypothetical protein